MPRAIFVVTILVLIASASATAAVAWRHGQAATSTPPVGCTMEAKLCPDGSAVGRTGPNCEFAPCPEPSVYCTMDVRECSDGSYVGRDSRSNCAFYPCTGPRGPGDDCDGPSDAGCGPGYRCIQRCGPPVARDDDPPPGYYCASDEVANQPRNCPICLAANTRIATPSGEVNVQDITVGDTVWSVDGAGDRVAVTVSKVSSTPVPATHELVHLLLADGREVSVSPGHPTASGVPVGELGVGDIYDGSTVTFTTRVPYPDGATYDILPAGSTGQYWANGILLGSTLERV